MKSEKRINKRILKLSMKIKKNFPELSKYILLTPVTIPIVESPIINRKTLQDYCDSLDILL